MFVLHHKYHILPLIYSIHFLLRYSVHKFQLGISHLKRGVSSGTPSAMSSPSTYTIPSISISSVDTGISSSMSSPSRFPLLNSPLLPRLRALRHERKANPSNTALMSTLQQSTFLHIVAILILLLSLGAAFVNQTSTFSGSSGSSGSPASPARTTTTTTNQQQPPPIPQSSPHQISKKNTSQNICQTHDLPNPLAALFPSNATGVLNATLAIIPIPLSLARHLVPAGVSILEPAYRLLIPDFPEGMYPVLLQAAHDHDGQLKEYGIVLEDFSVCFLSFFVFFVPLCPNFFFFFFFFIS